MSEQIVSLPLVCGITAGRGYVGVPFVLKCNRRGDHMRRRVKRRRVKRC